MNIHNNVKLAPYTSFELGGPAAHFTEVRNAQELIDVLKSTDLKPIWLLGYGSNTLISDKGLIGLTVCLRGGAIKVNKVFIEADAGVWWDDVVKTAIEHELWGTEFMSEIPGSVGGAAYINITAYGQSIGPLVEWVDVWDPLKRAVQRLMRDELDWAYKQSTFQKNSKSHLVILRVCLALHPHPQDNLTYQKALDAAEEHGFDISTLQGRRDAIVEARRRAGSLWKPEQKDAAHTAGSFFRNPTVSEELAEHVSNFDESGKTLTEIKSMNTVHGGVATRVSAAHVMLAAGFKRGQQWGNVKLNDQNLLKIEALPGATAQDVYDVVKTIQQTVQEKLGVTLEPEARILGEFS